MTLLSRRSLLGAAVLTAPFVSVQARAQGHEGSVLVTLPDASVEKLVIERIVPVMKERYKVDLKTQQASSASVLSAMRVQRRRPTYIAATLDLGYAVQALNEGLAEPVTAAKVPNLADLTPKALVADGQIASFILSIDTLCTNTTVWTQSPRSYADIFRSAMVGHTAVPSANSNIGLEFLAAASAASTGKNILDAAEDLEEGIRYLAQFRNDMKMIFSRSQEVMPLLASGEVGAAFNKTRFLTDWLVRGAPLDCSIPKEGAFYSLNCLVPVKNSPAPELGMAFIDLMLSPDIQGLWAGEIGSAPVNTKAKADIPERLKNVVPTPTQIERLALLPELSPQRIADLSRHFNSLVAR